MQVRVSRGRFDTAKFDETVALATEAATSMKGLPGFHSYQGGINRDAGTLVAISTWESAEAADFQREALGDVWARILASGVQLDPPEVYEVVVAV